MNVDDADIVLNTIKSRRSIRSYESHPVPRELIEKVLEAGRWAPSGANSQPWEFIIVTKKVIREKIASIFMEALNHDRKADPSFPFKDKKYMKNVPAFIFVCADPRLMETYPKFYPRGVIFIQSIAACIENMLLAATALGLGTVWITIPRHVELQLKDLLSVPEPIRIINVIPIGYPLEKTESKRKSLTELVHYEKYGSKSINQVKKSHLITSIRKDW